MRWTPQFVLSVAVGVLMVLYVVCMSNIQGLEKSISAGAQIARNAGRPVIPNIAHGTYSTTPMNNAFSSSTFSERHKLASSSRQIVGRAEERRYSFSDEIERYNEEQRRREEEEKRSAGQPTPAPRYSFADDIDKVQQPEEAPKHGPPSWEKPAKDPLGSLRAGMMKAAEDIEAADAAKKDSLEQSQVVSEKESHDEDDFDEPVDDKSKIEDNDVDEDDEEWIDDGSQEPPYLVSEYQARAWVSPVYKDLGPEAVEGVLDQEKMLRRSKFIVPRKLMIAKAEELLKALLEGDQQELQEQLSEDFEFVGPVVGPLNKKEFIRAYTGFKVKEALPDLKENIFGWQVDPMEPNRVWWFTRSIGTHTGQFGGSIAPTWVRVEWPPQVNSMCFDTDGNVCRLTLGYAVDRKMGNTGGLGAVFGLLNAIGSPLPFREAQPWRPSSKFLFYTKVMPQFRDLLKKGRDMRDRLIEKLDEDD
mmetsp:Transcript_6493/g.8977  ORF Transcript_6493/g.8977 Transcript_6493/m.8977 type:complete len:473 (+) Transcript_6493:202-1620(+)